jgi:hypothetical protein
MRRRRRLKMWLWNTNRSCRQFGRGKTPQELRRTKCCECKPMSCLQFAIEYRARQLAAKWYTENTERVQMQETSCKCTTVLSLLLHASLWRAPSNARVKRRASKRATSAAASNTPAEAAAATAAAAAAAAAAGALGSAALWRTHTAPARHHCPRERAWLP